jgi:predicted choloylglycine hydrolase
MGKLTAKSLVCLMLALLAACGSADDDRAGKDGRQHPEPLVFDETVVAGGPSDFMEVRHMVLRGSNFQIGKKLAQIAYSRYGSAPVPSRNRAETRAQRRYFKENYPVYLERMRGVAAAFEKKLGDDAWNFAGLYYGLSRTGSGCSVVFYPPRTTEGGRGVLSRNFDFTTGTFYGTKPEDGHLPSCGRPYVIEMYPDQGYSSLVICCFDLLGGACDGINSEGLAIALLSDNDVLDELGLYPAPGPRAGFNEIQIVRYLLDNCADASEAEEALREAKLYYNMVPNHYIIADRHGNSSIWENSPETDRGYAVQCGDEPLVTTNFLLHRYSGPEQLPVEEYTLGTFNRYREIKRRIAEHRGKFDKAFIEETNRCVSLVLAPPPEPYLPTRTLWHALYYPEQLRVEADFYLGEKADPAAPNGVRIKRSGYKVFALQN